MTHSPRQPPQRGPWVNAALLCTDTGADARGHPYIQGIGNGIQMDAGRPRPMSDDEPPELIGNGRLALILTAGDARGLQLINIDIEDERGAVQPAARETVDFDDDPRDWKLLTIPLRARFTRAGPYWINVAVNGRLLTRVQLDVLIRWRGNGRG